MKIRLFAALAFLALFTACNKNKRPTSGDPGKASTATGLAFGRTVEGEKEGGFEVNPFKLQPAGPNLVFVEGGRHILGSFEEDVVTTRDNIERTVTIASFYMDETEIANIHWLEYLHYLEKDSSEEI
ncbi:MAG: SUMF1/EgtB/PvdO family nonheme iron enzyme, partial [Bacteroidota bacterium]